MSARWAMVSEGVWTKFVDLRELTALSLREPARFRAELKNRPALALFIANLAAQLITLALAPVLTRLYTPADFGVLGALTGLAMIAVPLLSLRYELALPRARSDREALATLGVCAVSITTMTALLAVLAFTLNGSIELAVFESIRDSWYFLPLLAAAAAIFEVLGMEASRRGAIGPLAQAKLSQALLGGATQVGLGALKLGALGLLLGFLVNQAAGITRLGKRLVWQHPAGRTSWAEVRVAAIEHRDYARYTSWSSALDLGSRWAIQLAITVMWDPRIGGFIFLAERVIGRPLMILSTALLPVFVADFGRAIHDSPERLRSIFFSTFRRQAVVSVLWTAAVVVLAPLVFGPLFGPSWSDAVVYVQVMSLAIAPGTTLAPVGYALQLLGRQRMESWMVVSKIGLVMITLVVCFLRETSALIALGVFAGVQFVHAIAKLAVYTHVVTGASSERKLRQRDAAR